MSQAGHVFVVKDAPSLMAMAHSRLAASGHRATWADIGRAALDQGQADPPKAVHCGLLSRTDLLGPWHGMMSVAAFAWPKTFIVGCRA